MNIDFRQSHDNTAKELLFFSFVFLRDIDAWCANGGVERRQSCAQAITFYKVEKSVNNVFHDSRNSSAPENCAPVNRLIQKGRALVSALRSRY